MWPVDRVVVILIVDEDLIIRKITQRRHVVRIVHKRSIPQRHVRLDAGGVYCLFRSPEIARITRSETRPAGRVPNPEFAYK